MYPNLKAEMARLCLKKKDIAEKTGLSVRTVYKKMDGESCFTIDEALIIRDTYFKKMSLDYLFSKKCLNTYAEDYFKAVIRKED